MDGLVVEGQHAATRVLDDDDLVGPEQLLADDERADRVVGRKTTGVADDVSISGAKAEDVLGPYRPEPVRPAGP